jgi:pimeloyl-ACP methyl ester carboxylesterase
VVENLIFVEFSKTLTLMPGTVVKFKNFGGLYVNGALKILGTGSEKVFLTSFSNDSVLGDTNADGAFTDPYSESMWNIELQGFGSELHNAHISYFSGIVSSLFLTIEKSTIQHIVSNPALVVYSGLTLRESILSYGSSDGVIFNNGSNTFFVSSSTIEGFAGAGIRMNDGGLQVEASLFKGNTTGVFVEEVYDPILVKIKNLFIKTAHAGLLKRISQSSFVENTQHGLVNNSVDVVDVRNNWWGDISGPYYILNSAGLGDSIQGSVLMSPWLEADPFAVVVPECCSSVAFIPGFQASRLYNQGTFFENKLWEPNRNGDVEKLFLDESGVPIDSTIYTRDIIDEGLAVGPNIYEGFIEFMNGLVGDGTIAEWKSMPYDWRLKIFDIVQNPVKLENRETYKIVDEVIGLAERSPTGKVTLIGHSNGGLVSKEIVRELERRGKANLVDKLILVAVPQLGTPKAITGLLHGDGQILGLGFLLSKGNAKLFGEHMFGAYSFLPSEKYFEKVSDPVVVFDPSVSNVSSGLLGYGSSITSFEGLKSFMTAQNGDRVKPPLFDSFTPNVLKTMFVEYGEDIHDDLDEWVPPENIEVFQIAGWGLDTIKGVEYRAKETCDNSSGDFCVNKSYVLDRRPLFVRDGDGTVVTPSAVLYDVKNFYINLFKHNAFLEFNINREHADILETNPVRLLISNLVQDMDDLLEYVSEIQPPNNDINKRIRLSVHSPVSVGIYDSFGNHTGIATDPTTDLVRIEELVPNSYYMEFGEGKYVGFALDEEDKQVLLQGTGYGTFTIEVQKVEGDSVVEEVFFKDLLVTPLLSGEISMNTGTIEPILKIDIESDGIVDFQVSSGDTFDPVLYVDMIKKTILTLGLKKNVEKQLLQKADKAIQLIKKGKLVRVEEKIKKYIKQIDKKKKIVEDDRQVLVDMFTNLLNNLN